MRHDANWRRSFHPTQQAIGEAKSKQEEDRIIMDEMAVLKAKMPLQVIHCYFQFLMGDTILTFSPFHHLFVANVHKEDEGVSSAVDLLRDAWS